VIRKEKKEGINWCKHHLEILHGTSRCRVPGRCMSIITDGKYASADNSIRRIIASRDFNNTMCPGREDLITTIWEEEAERKLYRLGMH